MAANHENCILFYGGSNVDWVSRFTATANRVAQHRVLQQHALNISVTVLAVGPDNIGVVRQQLPTRYADGRLVDANDICQSLLNNQSGSWVVLRQGNVILLSDDGGIMLQVMENFDQQERWMRDLRRQGGFGGSFMNFHRRLN
ncbi:uncharacterized protein LOC122298595 [Carya illinoinensis]|uniref:uncharacterized protein LOC122298595 n=1 Tax=Carya illinoinensis TaxID=32201 RepID=UPI001C718C79|nr:uncharacterized protein LOC122298595 [Carya illinoinensis]